MELKDIIKTKEELESKGYGIENNVIKYVDVNVVAHFGNAICFEIYCDNIVPLSGYYNTNNLGYMIKAFVELLGADREDGVRLSELKNIPCRLVFENKNPWGNKAIGIGHFMKDKFVLFDDFVKIKL